MADDLTADVTIRNQATLEERTVPAGALPFFINNNYWVVLDGAGRRKASQPAATTDSKGV